jgi:hypothetical protein
MNQGFFYVLEKFNFEMRFNRELWRKKVQQLPSAVLLLKDWAFLLV